MRLKDGFITHESVGEHITVTAGNTAFNGMLRSNQTAGFIVECLKCDVTKEDIITKMLEKYDASTDILIKSEKKLLPVLNPGTLHIVNTPALEFSDTDSGKYYIKMYNPQTDRTKYKQYKCISGFNSNKECCWKFSRQGATKMIEDLKKYI